MDHTSEQAAASHCVALLLLLSRSSSPWCARPSHRLNLCVQRCASGWTQFPATCTRTACDNAGYVLAGLMCYK